MVAPKRIHQERPRQHSATSTAAICCNFFTTISPSTISSRRLTQVERQKPQNAVTLSNCPSTPQCSPQRLHPFHEGSQGCPLNGWIRAMTGFLGRTASGADRPSLPLHLSAAFYRAQKKRALKIERPSFQPAAVMRPYLSRDQILTFKPRKPKRPRGPAGRVRAPR